jgi:hypothetical protein
MRKAPLPVVSGDRARFCYVDLLWLYLVMRISPILIQVAGWLRKYPSS